MPTDTEKNILPHKVGFIKDNPIPRESKRAFMSWLTTTTFMVVKRIYSRKLTKQSIIFERMQLFLKDSDLI